MNVSVRWLSEMLGQALDPQDVAHRLALLGAPAESIEAVGADLQDVIIALVENVDKHPDADRLSLCRVNTGTEVLDVVCGAPNVTAGKLYPYAPVGTVLPGDFKIKKRKIRGVESFGMLCSASELGLGTDSDGIMELALEVDPGVSFTDATGLSDTMLDLEINPNRPDMLGHKGVARDLGAVLKKPFRLAAIPGMPSQTLAPARCESAGSTGGVEVLLEDREGCPRYAAASIKGIKVGPSPGWLQNRLKSIGQRPINNVVDATNYVMFELNQPLHAFDLDRLGGTVRIRKARQGETLVTLDGQKRDLAPHMTMICDAEHPIAIAGVMGGEDSEIGADTTNVLLECAFFDAAATRATRTGLKMSTDASYRFERGTDLDALPDALRRCVGLIIAVAGGQEIDPPVDLYPRPAQPTTIFLRPERVAGLLGVSFSTGQIERFLTSIGFAVAPKEDRLAVQVPGWRPDVTREVDLIEEIARLHGYDDFPSAMIPFRPSSVPDDPVESFKAEIRDLFASQGLHEARSASLGPEDGPLAQSVLHPLSSEEAFLRTRLMPGLLRSVERNWAVRERDVRLFEIGTVFEKTDEIPRETLRLAAVVSGARRPPHWTDGGATPDFDLWDLKGLMELAATLAGGGLDSDGDALTIIDAAGGEIGRGEAQQCEAPAWAGPVWGFEVTLSIQARQAVSYDRIPTTPPLERDLALVLGPGVTAARVEELIRATSGSLLESLVIFDEYTSDELEGRSVAWRLVLRSPKKTLRDRDADGIVKRIVKALKDQLGVELR